MSDPHLPFRGKPSQETSGGPTANPEWNKDIKAYYDAVASEPIPAEIQALMATLAKAVRK